MSSALVLGPLVVPDSLRLAPTVAAVTFGVAKRAARMDGVDAVPVLWRALELSLTAMASVVASTALSMKARWPAIGAVGPSRLPPGPSFASAAPR